MIAPARLALAGALALALAAPAPAARAQASVRVTGVVVDRAGRPVEYATVACPTHGAGVATDEQGRFALDLPPGRARLEVGQMGYEHVRLEVVVSATLAPLRVVLGDEPVALAEVSVEASTFGKAGSGEGATLRRSDVVTTPGGAADIMQALRALPGINAPNEGAAVYVRGGDPSETLIRLDGSEIGHPYHYEGASGGLFSALDSYLVKSAFFSSGGFSARYGGAMSGVLDIESQDPVHQHTVSVGANMAGTSLSGALELVPDRLSLLTSLRYSDVGFLSRVYGASQSYVTSPISHDALAKLLWRFSPAGRAALTALRTGDRTAVIADVLNVEAEYDERALSEYLGLDVSDAFGERLVLRVRGALQHYTDDWRFSGFGTAREEHAAQGRLEGVWTPGPRHQVTFGGGAERLGTRISGTLPADSVDIADGAPLRGYDYRPLRETPGGFVEDKLRLFGPVYATLGARADRLTPRGGWVVDPRAALAWRVDERQTVRVAGGRYHQAPDPRWLDATYGNPRLEPMYADHAIAGWEWLTDDVNARVEVYRKQYHALITDDATSFYANGGSGFARGVDVFLKGSHRSLTGWLSYGYLDSRRQEGDDPRLEPAAYGVRHSLTLVANDQWSGDWIIGARWGWSSGPPWTPVVGRVWDPARRIWRPVYAENHSALMPVYDRLDVRLTRLFVLPKGLGLPASAPCAAYVEGLNVLDTRNVLRYMWNSDYSKRYSVDSYFSQRMLVAGVALTW